jgi:LssY C-terminus
VKGFAFRLLLVLLLTNCRQAAAQYTFVPERTVTEVAHANSPKLVLEDGTPVKLRTDRTVSSADAHVGDLVDFEVTQDVQVGGYPVIPRGSVAWGRIVKVQGRRRMGRGGTVNIQLEFVQLSDGSRAALYSFKNVRGGGHATAMTVGMAATSLVYLPAAPALLLMRGQDSRILKGTEVTAYVAGNFPLEQPKVQETVVHKSAIAASASDPAHLLPTGPNQLTDLLNFLPRRVLDSQGNEGDAVNLIFLASEQELTTVFEVAGWVLADRSTGIAVVHALEKPKTYVAMPMSKLFLFGRPQDYGYEVAEPVYVVTKRHHVRVWKTDYEVGGLPVWLAAGTHDIGLGGDGRKWGITHKIDPEVDGERDFIAGSFVQTHLVTMISYELPADPVREGTTATGESYHSDGRLLLITVEEVQSARQQ